ncbi:MAG TPA: 16S rRNA (cytosine(967)-C(5))-methyltransferase RsmB [Blastocatellia bacterium]|nr:16S rRNA (cytosine(967)-C(5))-methyltransferase RsmB [Blastocatellia bacterium]
MPKQRESVSPARSAAFDILSRVAKENSYASVLIASLSDDLSREDRSLAQEIVLGVLRWQLSLDALIERYSGRSINRLDVEVLIALRIGLYQLRNLTRVPQSAAVNESVKLVKRARVGSAAPLVNAVLRKAANQPNETASDGVTDPLESEAVDLSHPRWMIERWSRAFGKDDTRLLALANNSAPTVAFRINTLQTSAETVRSSLSDNGVRVRESRITAGAYVVESGRTAVLADAVRAGQIYIQDEASQLIATLLDGRRGHRILDLCAAPGSKTTHIALLAADAAQIIACDLHHHRLIDLVATCKRLGIESVEALALDGKEPLPFISGADVFDRVLVDAPCSGTGTLRGNPEIKWRLTPNDIIRLADLQLELLNRGASAVAIEGRLVYSTCSLEGEENEGVVRRFLEGADQFDVIEPGAPADLVTREGFVRTYPHRHGTDGFFAAVLRRKR